jgi:ferric-dicitrate binding protein FerR (iron transport regulator)
MEILAFLIIVGVWAVFLLPSFFESHRSASLSSTRSFARNNDLLASVALQSAETVRATSRARRRRRRAVMFLGIGALGSLAAAVVTGSTIWLGVTIVFDVLLAGFVTALLQARAAKFAPVASVVPIDAGSREPLPEIEVMPTVRIVAG